jgi:hypothetical protein
MKCEHQEPKVVNRGPFDKDTFWCPICGSMKFPYAKDWVQPLAAEYNRAQE